MERRTTSSSLDRRSGQWLTLPPKVKNRRPVQRSDLRRPVLEAEVRLSHRKPLRAGLDANGEIGAMKIETATKVMAESERHP
jgi:hypothetical protein